MVSDELPGMGEVAVVAYQLPGQLRRFPVGVRDAVDFLDVRGPVDRLPIGDLIPEIPERGIGKRKSPSLGDLLRAYGQAIRLLHQNTQNHLPEQDDDEYSAGGGNEGFNLDAQGAEIDIMEHEQDHDRGACKYKLRYHEGPGALA